MIKLVSNDMENDMKQVSICISLIAVIRGMP